MQRITQHRQHATAKCLFHRTRGMRLQTTAQDASSRHKGNAAKKTTPQTTTAAGADGLTTFGSALQADWYGAKSTPTCTHLCLRCRQSCTQSTVKGTARAYCGPAYCRRHSALGPAQYNNSARCEHTHARREVHVGMLLYHTGTAPGIHKFSEKVLQNRSVPTARPTTALQAKDVQPMQATLRWSAPVAAAAQATALLPPC